MSKYLNQSLACSCHQQHRWTLIFKLTHLLARSEIHCREWSSAKKQKAHKEQNSVQKVPEHSHFSKMLSLEEIITESEAEAEILKLYKDLGWQLNDGQKGKKEWKALLDSCARKNFWKAKVEWLEKEEKEEREHYETEHRFIASSASLRRINLITSYPENYFSPSQAKKKGSTSSFQDSESSSHITVFPETELDCFLSNLFASCSTDHIGQSHFFIKNLQRSDCFTSSAENF